MSHLTFRLAHVTHVYGIVCRSEAVGGVGKPLAVGVGAINRTGGLLLVECAAMTGGTNGFVYAVVTLQLA